MSYYRDDKTNPCYGCQERFYACQDICEERKIWLEECELEKQKRKKERDIYYIYKEYKKNRRRRLLGK